MWVVYLSLKTTIEFTQITNKYYIHKIIQNILINMVLYKLFSLMKHTQKSSRDGWQWMVVIVVTVLYKIN